jgi:hypothetical protein
VLEKNVGHENTFSSIIDGLIAVFFVALPKVEMAFSTIRSTLAGT